MYSIIIADDEDSVREGIKTLINWNEIGLDLIGDVGDGLETYNIIKNKSPDIALIDINMPRLNGLNLIKKLKEDNLQCEIVIITGYDEFNYAREALRLGVNDYILKPLTKHEMVELLKNIVKKLELKRINEEKIAKEKRQLKDNINILRQEFINNIIFEDIEENNIFDKAEFLEIDIKSKYYALLLLEMDNPNIRNVKIKDEELRIKNDEIARQCNEILINNKKGYFFYTNDNEMAIIFISNEDNYEKARKEYINIIDEVKKYLNFEISIGVGCLVDKIYGITSSYFQARKALQYRFFIGTNTIIKYENIEDFKYNKNTDFSGIEENLFKNIRDLRNEQVKKEMNYVSVYMKKELVNVDLCKNEWIEITIKMIGIFMDMDVDIYKALGEKINVTKEISQLKDLEKIEKWVYNIYVTIQLFLEESVSNNKIYMISILNYINENYTKCDLSLKTVCEEVHLSMSYFSTIFKKYTNCTFVEYVTKLRMEKAKDLLKHSNEKTYRIAEMVGYSDTHYFSASFKKHFNITPSNYRKQIK